MMEKDEEDRGREGESQGGRAQDLGAEKEPPLLCYFLFFFFLYFATIFIILTQYKLQYLINQV